MGLFPWGQTEVQTESTLSTMCVRVCVCIPHVCTYCSLQGKISSVTWGRGFTTRKHGKDRRQNFLQLPWALRAWNEIHSYLGYRSISINCCVPAGSISCHLSERHAYYPKVPPALVSTIVLAKVTPSPTSLDFLNSSLSTFYSFSLSTGCPVVMCALQSRVSLA